MNKRGQDSRGVRIFVAIVFAISLLIILVLAYNLFWAVCSMGDQTVGVSTWILEHTPNFAKESVQKIFGGKFGSALDNLAYDAKGALGFNAGFCDFIADLITGILAGAILYLIYYIANIEKLMQLIPFFKKGAYHQYGMSLKNSWLAFVAYPIWKPIVFAITYAVVMQIPVINSVIKVITLEPLLHFKGKFFGSLIKAFMMALYVGFLPTAIEQYSRYKIRKKYYARIEKEEVLAELRTRNLSG